MATAILLPPDFKEFLRLLDSKNVEYLLIGGYAVGFYGYPRPTGDMDIWVRMSRANAERAVSALKEFGFEAPIELLLEENTVVRMGVPPWRLEIVTTIDGVDFDECYPARRRVVIDQTEVDIIDLPHLRLNKKASARPKDMADLENLPLDEP